MNRRSRSRLTLLGRSCSRPSGETVRKQDRSWSRAHDSKGSRRWVGLPSFLSGSALLLGLTGVQATLGARVLGRFIATANGSKVRAAVDLEDDAAPCVSIVVPVLNEEQRLGPCLEGLIAQGSCVGEILVVDGGSTDKTSDLVRGYTARNRRVRLIDAAPVPGNWNGKAWGLQVGLERGDPLLPWVLTIDADVRPAPGLAAALVAHAGVVDVSALSIATRQDVVGLGESVLHPSLLTTVVYRLGMPGHAVANPHMVQANGQCFLARRNLLHETCAITVARASRCEDITIARVLARAGYAVGFYEGDDLARVKMYEGWREMWRNWPRSLTLHDQFSGLTGIIGLCEATFVQALPPPQAVLLLASGRSAWAAGGMQRAVWTASTTTAMALTAVRLGVLVGTRRAYENEGPWYWLSPLCDLPAAATLWCSLLRRTHTWRGRRLV